MSVKAAGMSKILYFCNVKTTERHEVAAIRQRFLCPIFGNSKRIEWGSSNAPKGTAQLALTTRALSLFCLN